CCHRQCVRAGRRYRRREGRFRSRERHASRARHRFDVTNVLGWYARAVALLGTIVAVAAFVMLERGEGFAWTVAAATVGAMLLRWRQIPLTKYSALNMVSVVAICATLFGGVAGAGIGVGLGIAFADGVLLGKSVEVA